MSTRAGDSKKRALRSTTHRRAGQACVLLFASLVGKTATATTRFELTWKSSSAERACITETELKRAVSGRLGRDPFVPRGQGEIVIDGQELPATSGHLRARISQRDSEGRVLGGRDLDATSCEELRRSAAFVVFLIVDPEAALGGGAITPPPPEEGEDARHAPSQESKPRDEKPSVGKEERPAPTDEPAKRTHDGAGAHPPSSPRGVRVDLGLALVVSNGLLPKPDLGPALALGVELPTLPLRFEWRAVYRIPVRGVEEYDFSAVEQNWRACYFQRVFGALFGTACGGATWAAVLPEETRGLAKGDQAPKNVVGPMLALGPTIELGASRVFADLSLALPRPRYAFFFVDEGRTMPLYELSHVVWSLSIGVTRSFW